MQKIPVEEYAKTHEELAGAIQAWGSKYAVASEESVVPELEEGDQ